MDVIYMSNKEVLSGKLVCIVDPVGRKAGLDHYNDSLSANLRKLGTRTVVYSNYRSEYSVKKFPFRFFRSIIFIPGILFSFYRIFKKLKADKPDYVILHLFRSSGLLLLFSRQLKKTGKKLVFIVHDVESLISQKNDQSRMNELMKMSDEIVVHNEFSENELLGIYHSAKGKTNVIPHGDFFEIPSMITKSEARTRLGFSDTRPIILFFGMIKPTKGLDVLLKAVEDVDALLVVAGRLRMSSFSDYSTWTEKLKAEGKLFTDIKYISNEKRDLYLKAADVIVLPYRKIYQSGVLMLALSYQLPVIASDLMPNKEHVKDFKALELFTSGDHVELSRKLNKLLSDTNLQNALKENGVELLKQKHNWTLISEMFNKIICK